MAGQDRFAHMNEQGEVLNILCCDNYELANQLARTIYGDGAFAVSCENIVVSIGDHYNGKDFCKRGTNELCERIPTAEDNAYKAVNRVEALARELHPTINVEEATLDEVKEFYVKETGKVCEQLIYEGIDVETTQGIEHFSMTLADQQNMAVLSQMIQSGISEVPYHADGKPCRVFSANEFSKVATMCTAYKLQLTTRCNFINIWIRSCETKDDIVKIKFNSTLPEQLQAECNAVISAAIQSSGVSIDLITPILNDESKFMPYVVH